MYNPAHFRSDDAALLVALIKAHPFAVVTTVDSDKPFVNHLPIVVREDSSGISLLGHMSRHNPQWRQMKAGSPVLIAFQGPHAYINPSWYEKNDVPTWNYVVAHAEGTASIIEDQAGLVDILRHTSEQMNTIHEDQWEFYIPLHRGEPEDLVSAIVGFELRPTTLSGKFKLSQNRPQADRQGVIRGLGVRKDDGSLGVRTWMSK